VQRILVALYITKATKVIVPCPHTRANPIRLTGRSTKDSSVTVTWCGRTRNRIRCKFRSWPESTKTRIPWTISVEHCPDLFRIETSFSLGGEVDLSSLGSRTLDRVHTQPTKMPFGRQRFGRRAVVMLPFWFAQAWAWGGSNSGSDSSTTSSVFGNSLGRDWLSDSKGISIKLEGCLWGYVEDNESAYCMEDSSEDGTTYWYQMANCRRAQAVFSVYANPSSSNAACNAGNFKESVSRPVLLWRAYRWTAAHCVTVHTMLTLHAIFFYLAVCY
jgi:hypothetical protein